MKRIFAVALVLMLALLLCGCCLKHDMQSATCTEPSTCSKCGYTEGEALGHDWKDATCTEPKTCARCGLTEGEALGHTEVVDEAVEPSCTESGLTEGKHCSVCGEVLAAQEEIPPLGHDWEEATFMNPKVCRRCGEQEGEALGSEFFVREIFRDKEEAEAEEITVAEELQEAVRILSEEEKDGSCFEFLLSGGSRGIEALDPWLDSSSIRMTVDMRQENQNLVQLDLCVNGSEPLPVLLAFDEESLSFCLPGTAEEVYSIRYELLTEILKPYMENSGLPVAINPALVNKTEEDSEKLEQLRALGEKYLGVFVSFANVHNTTERLGSYRLDALDEEQLCLHIHCKPETNDWRNMLRTLLSTAKEDEELGALLAETLRTAAGNPSAREALRSLGFQDVEQLIESIPQLFDLGLGSVDAMARGLSGYGLDLAVGAGRLYALKISNDDAYGVGYESSGELEDGRRDALVLYSPEGTDLLLINEVRSSGERIKGKFSLSEPECSVSYLFSQNDGLADFDLRYTDDERVVTLSLSGAEEDRRFVLAYDADETGFEASVKRSLSDAVLVLPEGEKIEIRSEDEMTEALGKFVEKAAGTDFAAKLGELRQTEDSQKSTQTEDTATYKISFAAQFDSEGEYLFDIDAKSEDLTIFIADTSLADGSSIALIGAHDTAFGRIKDLDGDLSVEWLKAPAIFPASDDCITLLTAEEGVYELYYFFSDDDGLFVQLYNFSEPW